MFVLLVGLVFSGYKIVDYFYTSYDEKQNFNNVEKLVESEYEDEKIQYNDFEILKKYKKVYEKNNDLVGWIKIKDTNIDYPVMQTKDDYSYYLKRNFNKKSSIYGTPFVGDGCGINPNSDNVIIYGHNMKNGTMFGQLKNFSKDDSAYNKSKYFWIFTPEKTYRYEIISAYTTAVNSDTYTLFKGPGQEFVDYMNKIVSYSDVKTTPGELGVDDKIVTLSTCTGNESTRYVVQGKRVDTLDVVKKSDSTKQTGDN